MEIQSSFSDDGTALTIAIKGRFDYTSHSAFAQAYENLDVQPRRYILDFTETTAIDSAALGMMLILRKYAGDDDADIKIINCRPELAQFLYSCKFNELFNLA